MRKIPKTRYLFLAASGKFKFLFEFVVMGWVSIMACDRGNSVSFVAIDTFNSSLRPILSYQIRRLDTKVKFT